MILVDFIGHMVSTESEEELHRFAGEKLNMKRSWYQESHSLLKHPHYDLTSTLMIDKALRMGAEQVSPAELIRRAWWAKK